MGDEAGCNAQGLFKLFPWVVARIFAVYHAQAKPWATASFNGLIRLNGKWRSEARHGWFHILLQALAQSVCRAATGG